MGRLSERGYILLDVLVGLSIIAIGFAVFLGSLSVAGSITSRQGAALESLIEERSTHARDREVLFQHN
jgi:type II secretory pathway pseudopilin PulG